MRSPLLFAVVVVLLPTTVPAQREGHGTHATARLGSVDFPTSGATRARPAFLRGVALLHSFVYDEAAEAFREAQGLDSAFAMAYWAEALTYRHPLWGEERLDLARQALNHLAATTAGRLDRAPTARERAFGAAVEALFADADEASRARAFADSMHSVARAFPNDVEARAFSSLALLGLYRFVAPAERVRTGIEAGELARHVFETRPQHPGAAHYMIHAYDDPELAPHGLAAARAYAAIAPDASHAIHMPSHIFVQLGLWSDVVASNERSWAASRASVTARKEPATDVSFHDLLWLQYGYLQQGRWTLARSLIDTARQLLTGANFDGQVDARHATASLAFQWMTETGRWDPALAPLVRGIGSDTTSPRGRSMALIGQYQTAYTTAIVAGDTVPATTLAAELRARPVRPFLTMLASRLDALAAKRRGDSAAELAALERAATAEEAIPAYGPPGQPPAGEELATWLRQSGRASDAAERYTRALKRFPNRTTALAGLAAAQAGAGDTAAATRTRTAARANWSHADADALAQLRPRGEPTQAGKRP